MRSTTARPALPATLTYSAVDLPLLTMDALTLIASLVVLLVGMAGWLLGSWSGQFYYWRCPVAWVFDDAMLQGIKIPTDLLLKAPADGDFSWRGQRRYAKQLRAQYGVIQLNWRDRRLMSAERARRRKAGLPLAE